MSIHVCCLQVSLWSISMSVIVWMYPLESDELSGICICHSVICENDNNHHGVRNCMKSDMCRRNMRRIALDLEFL